MSTCPFFYLQQCKVELDENKATIASLQYYIILANIQTTLHREVQRLRYDERVVAFNRLKIMTKEIAMECEEDARTVVSTISRIAGI